METTLASRQMTKPVPHRGPKFVTAIGAKGLDETQLGMPRRDKPFHQVG